jgi:hypothetical protein
MILQKVKVLKGSKYETRIKKMTNLIVVVDPDYADRLERTAQFAPVWVVGSQTNRDACEQLWRNHPHPDHREKGAITSYKTSNPEDRLGSLLDIVPQLETHHGEVKDNELTFPNDFVLEVIGLSLADNVTNALRELGFTSFVETPEGFQACK